MFSRCLIILMALVLSAGLAQADPKDGLKEREKKRMEHRKEMEKKEFEHHKEMEKKRMEHEFEMGKKELEHHHEMAKKRREHEREMAHKHMEMEREEWKEGGWARKCGLPPGLARQGKIPPGWERKCRSGKKYYEHRDEFPGEVYEIPSGHSAPPLNSPGYQTVYAIDDADCKVQALSSSGKIAEGAAKGAVFGGLLGAAGGAVVEASRDGNVEHGALSGAAGGAVGGAILGGILASKDYHYDYERCMDQRGHTVQ
ncbi:MAG: hypothetical protein IIA62_06950 [Nitrospinae bacterium]|nr:hypothetical protein [Nitrospinota bacterium]